MSARVPVARTTPVTTDIKTGLPVLSTTHSGVARLLNWSLGHSLVNVPAFCPGNTIGAGSNGSYFFRVAPKYQAIQRAWAFTLRSTSTTAGAVVAIKVPSTAGSATATFTVGNDRETLNSFLVVENRSAQSAAEETVSCNLAVTGKAIEVEQIACWDMPRPQLAVGGDDGGVDLSTVAYRERIYDGTGQSIGGIVDSTIAALAACRRVLMQWALPATVSEALAITGTSYANALPGTSIVLARKLYRSSTTGTLSAKVYARTADTTDIADVRITTTSGASAVINIPTGSHAAFAWHGAPLTFAVDCEDLGEADGLPGGDWDELTVEAKVTAGGDILYLASISIWEA